MGNREEDAAIAEDPNWPFGEPDAMVWAEAFVAKGFTFDQIDVGLMVGWFANAMASADPSMLIKRAEEDGPVLRGTMRDADVRQMAQQCIFEIKRMRERLALVEPKADAYDNLAAVIRMAGPREGECFSVDIVRQLEQQIADLSPKPTVRHDDGSIANG